MDKKLWNKVLLVVLFSIAFAYIESAVVVYLRAIFYPDGFTFPIADFSKMPGALRFFLTEVGREAATMVLIFTGAWLIGNNARRRWAYFLIIFAVWDIFYYIWLKVLLNWPASVLDWDILFLMPMVWAGPVLAPVITSCVMLWFASVLLGEKPIHFSLSRIISLIACAVLVIVCFCIASLKITKPDYAEHFSWPIFIMLHIAVVVLLFRCIDKKEF